MLGCSAGSLFHDLSGCGGSLFEQCTGSVQPVCEGKGTVVFPSKAFDVTWRQVVPVQLRSHATARRRGACAAAADECHRLESQVIS